MVLAPCTSKLARKFQKLHEKTQIYASIYETSTKMPFTNKKGTSWGDATPQCDQRTPLICNFLKVHALITNFGQP